MLIRLIWVVRVRVITVIRVVRLIRVARVIRVVRLTRIIPVITRHSCHCVRFIQSQVFLTGPRLVLWCLFTWGLPWRMRCCVQRSLRRERTPTCCVNVAQRMRVCGRCDECGGGGGGREDEGGLRYVCVCACV